MGINEKSLIYVRGVAEPISALEAAVIADSTLSEGKILRFIIDSPNNRRLHRYVVPVFENSFTLADRLQEAIDYFYQRLGAHIQSVI